MSLYAARLATLGSLALGDLAYYEYMSGHSLQVGFGTVTRVTKTQVTVQRTNDTLTFRFSNASDRYQCKADYAERTLITKETYEAITSSKERDRSAIAARRAAIITAEDLRARRMWMTSDDIENAIIVLQEQAAALKALGL